MKPAAARCAATCVVLSAFAGVAEVSAQARAAAPAPVKVRLVAAPAAASRPSTAWVGLRFEIERGWHIYWRNPGDSGGPPEVRWALPAGAVAGPLRWPVPERIPADGIVNYGYHGDVVLPAELRAPAGGWPAGPFVVAATVKWLVCREVCLPGKADVSIEFPAGGATPSGRAAPPGDVARALARVPGPLPAGWRVTGSQTGDSFSVSIETGHPESTADFFPMKVAQVDAASPVAAAPHPRGVTLTLRKSDFLSAPVASLEGVVVLSGGRAYEVSVPITNHRNHP